MLLITFLKKQPKNIDLFFWKEHYCKWGIFKGRSAVEGFLLPEDKEKQLHLQRLASLWSAEALMINRENVLRLVLLERGLEEWLQSCVVFSHVASRAREERHVSHFVAVSYEPEAVRSLVCGLRLKNHKPDFRSSEFSGRPNGWHASVQLPGHVLLTKQLLLVSA